MFKNQNYYFFIKNFVVFISWNIKVFILMYLKFIFTQNFIFIILITLFMIDYMIFILFALYYWEFHCVNYLLIISSNFNFNNCLYLALNPYNQKNLIIYFFKNLFKFLKINCINTINSKKNILLLFIKYIKKK